MWLCVAVFLLWTKSGGCLEKANTSNLVEYTAADFYEKLSSGKMMFLYFERQGKCLKAVVFCRAGAVLVYVTGVYVGLRSQN